MSVRFEINYDDVKLLEEKMAKLPNRMEKVINDVLHNDGIKIATEEITSELPVSTWKGSIRPKNHAKTSNWSKGDKENLGFTVKSRGNFDYLIFPNDGRGRSNPVEQRFMEKGLEKAVPRIMQKLMRNVDKTLKEEL